MTTITIDKELLEQVVNKLLTCWPKSDPLVNELRAALAAPATAPEPVAWMSPKRFYRTRAMALINGEQLIEPLYAAPQPERKHTEAEVQELMYHYVYAYDGQFEREARRILGVPKP